MNTMLPDSFLLLLLLFFFFFDGTGGLNSGLSTSFTGNLPLEPLCQPSFLQSFVALFVFFEAASHYVYVAQTGLEPLGSPSHPLALAS
jgi:hypothetical protein